MTLHDRALWIPRLEMGWRVEIAAQRSVGEILSELQTPIVVSSSDCSCSSGWYLELSKMTFSFGSFLPTV